LKKLDENWDQKGILTIILYENHNKEKLDITVV